jgi:hypothetical protein
METVANLHFCMQGHDTTNAEKRGFGGCVNSEWRFVSGKLKL